MNSFLAFIIKEIRHILRDRRTMLILLGMPIVQIILFGFAISTEVKNIRIGILDPSNDEVTRRITERFDANEYFIVSSHLNSPEEIERAFQQNRVDMVLQFEDQFNNKLYRGGSHVYLITDACDPNQATMRTNYAKNILLQIQQELHTPAMSQAQIIPNIKLLYNPQMRSAYNFVPGIMGLILMLICAMMTSIAIVREKETGTMEQLLVSPIKPIFVILAKITPYFILSFINLTTILLLSHYLLDVPLEGGLVWIFSVSLLFIFVSLSLGLLVSTLTHTQVAAMLASGLVLMMPTILLSGMIFPIESMPLPLQWFSAILPVRWYISAIRKLMIEGVSIYYVRQEVTILAFMALFLITVSLSKFKNRLE